MTNAATLAAVAASGFRRNRIQNGAMQIDQRTGGAGITAAGFAGDRWAANKGPSQAFKAYMSGRQFLYEITTGAASAAGDYCGFQHQIEGSDVSDLFWGNAGCLPVTVSFAAYSTLPGLYTLRMSNMAGNRSYVATYTINAANTWENKAVTIPGDTTGTWGTTPADKWQLNFDMGSGTNFNATAAGVWSAGNFTRIAASVNFAAAARQFRITNVQLEAGSVATPFEWLPIRQQLADCQRWFQKIDRFMTSGYGPGAGSALFTGVPRPVTMRATPTVVVTNQAVNNAAIATNNGSNANTINTFTSVIAAGPGYSQDILTFDCEGV